MTNKLSNLIARDNVGFKAIYGAAKKRAPFNDAPNNWRVTLTRKGRQLSTDFYGGSAVYDISAADVLYSLCVDASCADNTFEDFCSDFGYDTDSRKAYDIFQACGKNQIKLAKFLGSALEEYCSAEH